MTRKHEGNQGRERENTLLQTHIQQRNCQGLIQDFILGVGDVIDDDVICDDVITGNES